MIEITYENCPSFRICCGSDDQGTGFVIAQDRILTARHVVTDALLDEKTTIMLEVPGSDKIELAICGPEKEKREIATLVMLQPKNPQEHLPDPPPFYRHAVRIEEGTPMKAYGYRPGDSGKHARELKSYADFSVDNPIEGAEQRTGHFTTEQEDASGLSGSPILCKGRLVGILIAQMTQNGKCEYLYGFGGDAFFRELEGLGIHVPASPAPPELNKSFFKLPKVYQLRMTERLNEALEKQRSGREDGLQKPIFLRGTDGIGKKEFLWAFAKQYEAGYVYHLDFVDDFQTTIEEGDRRIVPEGETIKERLRLLRECGEADILIITGADFAIGYTAEALNHTTAYEELCRLPIRLVITTRQPVPEERGGLLLELEQISVEELLSWDIDRPTALSSDPVAAKALIVQAENNPMLVRIIMRILCQDSSLTPEGMLNALRDPSDSSARAYWDTIQSEQTSKCRLFDCLDPKMPHPKNKSPEYDDCKDILILILDELQMCDSLTTAEFDYWVSKNKKTKAFDKLRHIGMIEEDPRGCYTIPIIPRLLLKRENCGPTNSNRQSFIQHRSEIRNLRVKPAATPEEYRRTLIDELTEKCADPYDGFSLFCTANKQALETYLPELFAFGQHINQALMNCGLSADPMESLKEAETLLAQICQDEQSQKTILAAKLYDTFHSALYMFDHSENADPEACCNSLLRLFGAVLKLRPDLISCFVMKSQVYWSFCKEDEAYNAAKEVLSHVDFPQDHYCADAFMIQGQYLEKRADEQLERNAKKSCAFYEDACENYEAALSIRSRSGKQNLQRNRQDLFRLIQCKGMVYWFKPQMWKRSGGSRWVWTYGLTLLENDWKIFEVCKIDDDFINDSKILLSICLAAEKGIGADADSNVAKEILATRLKILKYMFEKLSEEKVKACIVACEKCLEEPAECQGNSDVPDAHNG